MKYNPAKHHRMSMRLRGYDYASSGAYFVTMNIQDRLPLFGVVDESGMQLTDIGRIAHQCWAEIPIHFPHAALDEFIIMPDHMHGIIFIFGDEEQGGVQLNAPTGMNLPTSTNSLTNSNAPTGMNYPTSMVSTQNANPQKDHTRKDNYYSQISPRKKTLSVIVRTYKAAVTRLCRENNFHHFAWQRNYYDHIIRNERQLIVVCKYIINNPKRWWSDKKERLGM